MCVLGGVCARERERKREREQVLIVWVNSTRLEKEGMRVYRLFDAPPLFLQIPPAYTHTHTHS